MNKIRPSQTPVVTRPIAPVAPAPAPVVVAPAPVVAAPVAPAPVAPVAPVAPARPTAVTLRQTFDGVDSNRNDSLSRSEVKSSMEGAGIGSGFFGGMKVDAATDALVTGLDANQDGKVAWREYVKGGHNLAPAGMNLDPTKMKDPAKIEAAVAALYREADGDGNGLSQAELSAHQTKQAQRAGESNASTRGDIAATLTIQKLDHNRDGKLQKSELAGFLKDVAREQQGLAAPRPAS